MGADLLVSVTELSVHLHRNTQQVSLAHGHSEGMLVYVYAQANRYKPGEIVPLLRIKLLCGVERALKEMQAIWAYLNDSPEFVRARTRK